MGVWSAGTPDCEPVVYLVSMKARKGHQTEDI